MSKPHRVTVVVVLLSLAASSVIVADSPYDSNVVAERNPFAPERPATVNETTAVTYLVAYEETRFQNDLLRSRGQTIDTRDEVRTDCTAAAANRTAAGAVRVRLRCSGGVHDTYRLVQPTDFTYTVTYWMTDAGVEQLAVHNYPYASRDQLRPRPTAAR